MRSFRMSWFLTLIILCFRFNNLSEAKHENELPSAVVVGTVYCDTCFQKEFSMESHFISGASVAVECGDVKSKPNFRKEVKTNEHGEFKVYLPISVSKHAKKIKGCAVKLISSSEPYCAVASTATSSSLHLKSRKQGTHIFSAGFFTFKPLKQPNLCNQKPSLLNSRELNSLKKLIPPTNDILFPPPIQDPLTPNLPPIDQTHLPPLPLLPLLPPLPTLTPLPPLPGFPNFPPVPGKTKTESKQTESLKTSQLSNQKEAHPEFFLPPLFPSPPPAIGIPLPPNPLQPPSIFPPNPLQPPSIFPPIPGIPGLTPTTPPPALPFPFPPIFPVPPRSPGFPGIPPASSSPNKISP